MQTENNKSNKKLTKNKNGPVVKQRTLMVGVQNRQK